MTEKKQPPIPESFSELLKQFSGKNSIKKADKTKLEKIVRTELALTQEEQMAGIHSLLRQKVAELGAEAVADGKDYPLTQVLNALKSYFPQNGVTSLSDQALVLLGEAERTLKSRDSPPSTASADTDEIDIDVELPTKYVIPYETLEHLTRSLTAIQTSISRLEQSRKGEQTRTEPSSQHEDLISISQRLARIEQTLTLPFQQSSLESSPLPPLQNSIAAAATLSSRLEDAIQAYEKAKTLFEKLTGISTALEHTYQQREQLLKESRAAIGQLQEEKKGREESKHILVGVKGVIFQRGSLEDRPNQTIHQKRTEDMEHEIQQVVAKRVRASQGVVHSKSKTRKKTVSKKPNVS